LAGITAFQQVEASSLKPLREARLPFTALATRIKPKSLTPEERLNEERDNFAHR
jgi:hypothetical protein